MVSLLQAVKLPFSNGKKLLFGGLMFVVPFLSVITGIFAFGYVLQTARNVMQNSFTLPEWKNWGTLFIEGLKGLLIGGIYFVPAILISFLLVRTPIIDAIGGDPNAIANAWIGLLAVFILFLATSYVIPAALLSFISAQNLFKAFNIPSIVQKIFSMHYFKIWFKAFLVYFALNFIFGLLSSVLLLFGFFGTVLAFIFAAFFVFVSLITTFAIYAQAFSGGSHSQNNSQ